MEIGSADGEHRRATELRVHALGTKADPQQVTRLRRILDAKSHASYSGSYYTLEDARDILR